MATAVWVRVPSLAPEKTGYPLGIRSFLVCEADSKGRSENMLVACFLAAGEPPETKWRSGWIVFRPHEPPGSDQSHLPQHLCHAVTFAPVADPIRQRLQLWIGIPHSNAHPSRGQHFRIVHAVTEGNGIRRGLAEMAAYRLQCPPLVDGGIGNFANGQRKTGDVVEGHHLCRPLQLRRKQSRHRLGGTVIGDFEDRLTVKPAHGLHGRVLHRRLGIAPHLLRNAGHVRLPENLRGVFAVESALRSFQHIENRVLFQTGNDPLHHRLLHAEGSEGPVIQLNLSARAENAAVKADCFHRLRDAVRGAAGADKGQMALPPGPPDGLHRGGRGCLPGVGQGSVNVKEQQFSHRITPLDHFLLSYHRPEPL